MIVIHAYLFEAKSIQAYLFRSGRVRDIIAASERLDRLVDSHESSTLFQVLNAAGLNSDLLDASQPGQPGLIRFLRCKGGAFYAYCETREPLVKLRALWTLTLPQMFPTLDWVDALTNGATLPEAITAGHAELAADRNTPTIKLPIAPTVADYYRRTGAVAEQMTELARCASAGEEAKENADSHLDGDIIRHREAYGTSEK